MDLGRRPARKHGARRRGAEGARHQPVDRQSRPPPARSARRRLVRHLHPHLRKAPRLVQAQLAPPHVRRVIDLEHYVRKVVLARHHRLRARQAGAPGMHVHGFVGLQDAPRRAVFVELHQVHRAVALDGRPAFGGNAVHELRQPARGPLVIRGGRLGDPRCLGGGVPVLQASLPSVDLAARHALGRAAGERDLHCRRRRGGGCVLARNVRLGFEVGHASILLPARRPEARRLPDEPAAHRRGRSATAVAQACDPGSCAGWARVGEVGNPLSITALACVPRCSAAGRSGSWQPHVDHRSCVRYWTDDGPAGSPMTTGVRASEGPGDVASDESVPQKR